jgi:DNA-binding XRE family transcriptional regulator
MSRTAAILDRLIQLRNDRSWTQAEMGRRIALTEEAYRSLEKGRTIRLEWETIWLLSELVAESGLTWEGFLAAPPAEAVQTAGSAPARGAAPAAHGPKNTKGNRKGK